MCHCSIIKWISAYYQKSQLNFLSSHFYVWTIDESVTHAYVSLCVPRDCVGNRKLVWSVCVCVCACVSKLVRVFLVAVNLPDVISSP